MEPKKKKEENKSSFGCTICFFVLYIILLLLCLLGYKYWRSLPFANVTSKGTLSEFPKDQDAIPTGIGLAPPAQIEETETWVRVNRYDTLPGKCFNKYTILVVNNRLGNHDACFGACEGWNLANPKKLCVGWTTILIGSTHTCHLKSEVDHLNMEKDPRCSSGKMWEDSDTLENNGQGTNDLEMKRSNLSLASQYLRSSPPGDQSPKNGANVASGKPMSEKELLKAVYSSPLVLPDCNAEKNGSETSAAENGRAMRVFIVGAQASGATMLPYLMGQNDDSVAILDIGVRQTIPDQSYFAKAVLDNSLKNIVIKATVRGISHSPKVWLKHARQHFQPDYSILFLRNPVDLLLHLISHMGVGTKDEPKETDFRNCYKEDFAQYSYGLRCGTPVGKLQALNELFLSRVNNFQRVITYEDLCLNRTKVVADLNHDGYCTTTERFNQLKYSIIDVLKKGFTYFPSSHDSNGLFWGAGHLLNTFHHPVTGEVHTEAMAFGQCSLMGEEDRTKLIQYAGSPYNEWSLGKLRDLAIESAPDIARYYSERGML